MANFFEKVEADASGLEQSLLGPDYKYYQFINTPSEMGMSDSGSISTIENNIAGLIGYVNLLSSGKGEASKTGGPLGNKFFLETGAKCKDVASGESVTRSLYVNNVPDGSIPFISQGLGGVNFTEFKGLIPGTLSNLSQINPMQIFGAFMSGTTPDCQAITMETVDVNGVKGQNTAFVTNNDIQAMSACWFSNNTNPITGTACKEAFSTMSDSQEYNEYINKYNKKYLNKDKQPKQDYSKMHKDPLVKVYYSSLSLLLLYIFYKVFQERK
jgi:hypothetical protein